jgi:DNA-binding PadR family transcriptional regulator
MSDIDELYSNQALELRRGTIVLAALAKLQQPHYGYALLQALESAGVSIDAGTLYPLMRRLEKQGILTSSWDTSESRPRKYYQLSDNGKQLYERLQTEWYETHQKIDQLMKGERS